LIAARPDLVESVSHGERRERLDRRCSELLASQYQLRRLETHRGNRPGEYHRQREPEFLDSVENFSKRREVKHFPSRGRNRTAVDSQTHEIDDLAVRATQRPAGNATQANGLDQRVQRAGPQGIFASAQFFVVQSTTNLTFEIIQSTGQRFLGQVRASTRPPEEMKRCGPLVGA
jgi:hypothetical protein